MTAPDDPFDLARFVAAQDPVMAEVRRELHEGRKRTHWMWFVFPQLRGLGVSATARYYGRSCYSTRAPDISTSRRQRGVSAAIIAVIAAGLSLVTAS